MKKNRIVWGEEKKKGKTKKKKSLLVLLSSLSLLIALLGLSPSRPRFSRSGRTD